MATSPDQFIAGYRVTFAGEQYVANYVWDTGTLSWVAQVSNVASPGSNVNVTNSSIPVTQGGAWTATVTGPLTDTQLRASAVPVSGPLTDALLRASAVPMSLATLPALVAGAAKIGQVAIDQTTPGTTNLVALSPETTKVIGTVNPPAITKGSQGANGFTTQDLKDSGRVNVSITCFQAAGIITTEALFATNTFSKSADGAAASTGVQFTVTSGKRFRVQSILVNIKNTAAAAGTSKLVLRYAAAGGTITTSSPIAAIWDLGSNNATANNYIGPVLLDIPDGMEFLSTGTFGFTSLCSAATMLHTISMHGYEY